LHAAMIADSTPPWPDPGAVPGIVTGHSPMQPWPSRRYAWWARGGRLACLSRGWTIPMTTAPALRAGVFLRGALACACMSAPAFAPTAIHAQPADLMHAAPAVLAPGAIPGPIADYWLSEKL